MVRKPSDNSKLLHLLAECPFYIVHAPFPRSYRSRPFIRGSKLGILIKGIFRQFPPHSI
jgi:hypothetical protein